MKHNWGNPKEHTVHKDVSDLPRSDLSCSLPQTKYCSWFVAIDFNLQMTNKVLLYRDENTTTIKILPFNCAWQSCSMNFTLSTYYKAKIAVVAYVAKSVLFVSLLQLPYFISCCDFKNIRILSHLQNLYFKTS